MIFGKSKNEEPQAPSEVHSLAAGLDESLKRYKKREALRFESRTYTYEELDEEACKVAGGLASLGITKGDCVALMLPNIPEFAFTFYGIQKLGAIAVPFNTMYKGREIAHILKDSGAKAIVCLSNFASLIQEIQGECPDLQHVITTGQRTFVYVEPEGSVNIQMVFEKAGLPDADQAWRTMGETLVKAFHSLGAKDAWYSHKGAIRAHGRKLATILLSEIENLYIFNIMTWLKPMNTEPLFKVIFVPPEVKERALEPLSNLEAEAGRPIEFAELQTALTQTLSQELGIEFEAGKLTRDEIISYEKNRALAGRTT